MFLDIMDISEKEVRKVVKADLTDKRYSALGTSTTVIMSFTRFFCGLFYPDFPVDIREDFTIF